MAKPVQVLHWQRPVQPKRPPERLDLLISSLRPKQNLRNIARDQVHQREYQDGDPQKYRNNGDNAANDILPHRYDLRSPPLIGYASVLRPRTVSVSTESERFFSHSSRWRAVLPTNTSLPWGGADALY